jgi:hypothetical protein
MCQARIRSPVSTGGLLCALEEKGNTMDYLEKLRSFDFLGGQHAPPASRGMGVQILYRCPACQRIWLQDGTSVILDLRPDQVQSFAQQLSADLTRLPASLCRPCIWRTGGISIEIDEYNQGESFGLSWQILRPAVLHAISALLSSKATSTWESRPDVLTQHEKLRAVLHAVNQVARPQYIQRLPSFFGLLQALTVSPGFGQEGTAQWQWQGWAFRLSCPPLDASGPATVIVMLALPPTEQVTGEEVFRLWQQLVDLTLLCGVLERSHREE